MPAGSNASVYRNTILVSMRLYTSTGCKMPALDVYYEFNPQLINSLPMKDAKFSSQLVKKGLFSGNMKAKVKAQPTDADSAEYFLDNVIEKPLSNEDTEPFEKLLMVMEQFNNQSLKKLARNIRKKLGGENSDTGGRSIGQLIF